MERTKSSWEKDKNGKSMKIGKKIAKKSRTEADKEELIGNTMLEQHSNPIYITQIICRYTKSSFRLLPIVSTAFKHHKSTMIIFFSDSFNMCSLNSAIIIEWQSAHYIWLKIYHTNETELTKNNFRFRLRETCRQHDIHMEIYREWCKIPISNRQRMRTTVALFIRCI